MSPQIDKLDQASSAQRNNLNHQAVEDYLKTIFMLAEVEEPVSTSRIAEARDVKPASATNMIQRLAKLNLVNYEKHYGVTLTDNGRKIALEVIRHHRLIELYLMEALQFTWDEVHEQADILEHVISEKLEERIAAALNYPTLDPHGDPIPAKDGTIVARETQPLGALAVGDEGRIARVVDDADGDLLRQLAELGLVPGSSFRVTATTPMDGPLSVVVDGEKKVIGRNIAGSVLVELA